MGFHNPFGYLKHKLWRKGGEALKVWNCPDFLVRRWCATYRWKALDKGHNFTLELISIEGLHTKLWALQSRRSPNYGNFEIPIWVLVLWLSTKYTIKGKVVASPKFEPC